MEVQGKYNFLQIKFSNLQNINLPWELDKLGASCTSIYKYVFLEHTY